MQLPRSLLLLGCGLFVVTSAQDDGSIEPTNTTTGIADRGDVYELQTGSKDNVSRVEPLTQKALLGPDTTPPSGNLFRTDDSTVKNISSQDILYLSCDAGPGFLNPHGTLQEAFSVANFSAVLLYSTSADYCQFTNMKPQMQENMIFSMTDKKDSQQLLDRIQNLPVSSKYFVSVNQVQNSNGPSQPQETNPLGPSPSTAVAMIILYSITGIITALFLVIIITGAVRAHRNPERYGPRNVLGRPRQSRARGIGRAILETIPIVKFGDRQEPPKPADIELGASAEARNVNAAGEETQAGDARSSNEQDTTAQSETRGETAAPQDSGIAPAQPAAAGSTKNENSTEEGLGCSICTDDFEKGQDIRVLPCNHKFHPDCVDPWLLNVSGTCPLCRVDLRPTTSHSSTGGDAQDADSLAPPLQPDAEQSSRRRSALRDILSLRSRPNASAEERISALRRLREQRQNQSGDIASGSANASTDDVANVRRSRRISARFHDAFSIRTRRNGQQDDTSPAPPPVPVAEASSSSPARAEDSASNDTTNTQPEQPGRSVG
ncbi:hypothetical protein EJ04DRAFT_71245 [Polyplosphaeria fusca]|uniref:RING-type domain-containing protein n=1 Tax=Polyplosphaeria fusca TaxID=682080 RepID=A0A9P4R7B8_9PLEO|nr:hypothetical protein EJ04DRAFT_71245 [Polyplosphaeria fusca]